MPQRRTSSKSAKKSAAAIAFGEAVRRLRAERSISQEELSFRGDVDRSYVSKLEGGGKEPCLGVILRLAEALEIRPSEIFLRMESSKEPKK